MSVEESEEVEFTKLRYPTVALSNRNNYVKLVRHIIYVLKYSDFHFAM